MKATLIFFIICSLLIGVAIQTYRASYYKEVLLITLEQNAIDTCLEWKKEYGYIVGETGFSIEGLQDMRFCTEWLGEK